MNIRLCVILLSLSFTACVSFAQDTLNTLNSRKVSSYTNAITNKTGKIDQQLYRYTDKAMNKVVRQEARLKKRLQKIDSLKAATVFTNTAQSYQRLQERLKKPGAFQQYIPSFDTMSSSLKFLQDNLAVSSDVQGKVKNALAKVKGMEDQFQRAEEVKKFLKERKQFLKDQLKNLGFAKEIKKINKQAWYYGEQLSEYKALLKDHKKVEKKVIALLSKNKVFNEFMRKNSVLASLFRIPGDPNDPANMASLASLQTRAQVNSLIQQQISAGGPNAQQQVQQNLQAAQAQLTSLKNKVNQIGKSNSEAEIPEGFKPNNQRTKSFLQRIEFGTNIQSQKANGYFPVTSDIGVSAGYKLNDKSIIGIGGSYKLGLGRNIQNIHFTNQGVSIRSYADWKIKGSFWLSGGYEMNYRSAFRNVNELHGLDAWQTSGLIGVSKVISLKTKFFKKTKLQLLWDALSYEQVPRTQPILIRIGYNF